MIKTLIFDFGDVFINLNKAATAIAFKKLGITSFSEEMQRINKGYETGRISSSEFINFYAKKFPNITKKQISSSWNSIILDFPEYRLQFIEALSEKKEYKLLLLSNTNELHIEKVIESMSEVRYNRFKNCFDAFYLSHKIHFRKPNSDIFEFILKNHNLNPNECFFVDDTEEHINTAKKIGFHTWNINPEFEDIIDLFTLKKELF